MRPIEAVKVERVVHPGNDHGTRETHPAYGQIQANRVNGHAHLYGSDFDHHGYIVITIRRSEMNRMLSHDWPHGREELIEVALSYSQWAQFVSDMNNGLGVQCTIQAINHHYVPGLPKPQSKADLFIEEQRRRINELQADLDQVSQDVEALNITVKAKEVMRRAVWKVRRVFQDSLPFAMKSFGQHVETTVDRAKTEVNAYVENRIHRAGLQALDAAMGKADERPPVFNLESRNQDGNEQG